MSHFTCPNVQRRGQIQVIFGPMFSGKTTELIRRLKRYQIANYKCLIVKYQNDNRYGNNGICTHDKQSLPAQAAQSLSEISTDDYEVIGIDEGQFFPDIVPTAESYANKGKIVIIAALDGTYQRLPFGNILNLVPLAESVMKLNAVCMTCFQDASYTKRTTKDHKLEVIGGADKYMSVCRECYFSTSTLRSSPRKFQEKAENSFMEQSMFPTKLFMSQVI